MSALSSPLPDDVSRQLVRAADLARRGTMQGRREALPTAVPPLDRLLAGGLPRGTLVEVTGSRSSGRFSLALSVLAAATETGEAAAFVDLGDHFDPQAAAASGADLPRLLWVRPRTLKEALLAAETLLSAGVPVVVLDLGLATSKISLWKRARHEFAFLRLSRTAESHGAALLVLSPFHVTGPAAEAVLAAGGTRAGWSRSLSGGRAALPLLLGLSSRLFLEKLRGQRPGGFEALPLQAPGVISSKERTPETESDQRRPAGLSVRARRSSRVAGRAGEPHA
jgi:hypothetical protein